MLCGQSLLSILVIFKAELIHCCKAINYEHRNSALLFGRIKHLGIQITHMAANSNSSNYDHPLCGWFSVSRFAQRAGLKTI